MVDSRSKSLIILAVAVLAMVPAPSTAVAQVRIKDITDVAGVRENQLIGMGLVTGLNGTGGKNPETRQFALNLLQRHGIRAEPEVRALLRNDTRFKTGSLSVVVVTADLPSFSRKGSRINVTVSTFDDATSLGGGQLQLTPLFGIDNKVYAIAAGALTTGGFSFSGQSASVQKNHPTVGRIPNGATVERETCTPIGLDGRIQLLLLDHDYETASRIGQVINIVYPEAARVIDSGTVDIMIPPAFRSDVPNYMSLIGQFRVLPDVRARVVINERTGTVVIGENVRLSPGLVAHANLSVITAETPEVSQPAPFSEGETTVVPRTELNVVEEKKKLSLIGRTSTVGDLASALNALGVTPRDLSSIFLHLKDAGLLHAELEFK